MCAGKVRRKGQEDYRATLGEKIRTIRGLVAAATGFSGTRGDQLTVETLPFESTLGAEPPSDLIPVVAPPPNPLPKWLQKYVKDMSTWEC
jgi:flagellar biosynthesis/type III secretory pathway M-ring protein FliF/YscJ